MRRHEAYVFGEFTLDVTERRLLKSGTSISLAPKAQDLLAALVRHAGSLVGKRELLDRVWPEASVEEGILAVHVAALRKALGDRALIETVPRAGYRFAGAVRRISLPQDTLSMRWPIGVLPAQPAVFELIGRGRSCLSTASRSDVPKAVAAFREAIELDPTYAAAHAGLALACCAQAELRLTPVAEAYSDARGAALRALAMDDASADAQVALATVLFLSDWNWTGAKRSVERALELDPDHTEGWLLYGRLMETLGDLEQGLAAKQKALERQPSSAAVHLQIAMSYWNQRRYDDVIEWANRSLALDPAHLLAREFTAAAYLKQGNLDRHMEESLAHARAHGVPAEVVDELKRVYARDGRAGVVDYALRHAGAAPAVQLALLHGELGNLDEAFRQLDAAIERRDPSLVHIAVAPQWDCLRDDPRFADRITSMGLRARTTGGSIAGGRTSSPATRRSRRVPRGGHREGSRHPR